MPLTMSFNSRNKVTRRALARRANRRSRTSRNARNDEVFTFPRTVKNSVRAMSTIPSMTMNTSKRFHFQSLPKKKGRTPRKYHFTSISPKNMSVKMASTDCESPQVVVSAFTNIPMDNAFAMITTVITTSRYLSSLLAAPPPSSSSRATSMADIITSNASSAIATSRIATTAFITSTLQFGCGCRIAFLKTRKGTSRFLARGLLGERPPRCIASPSMDTLDAFSNSQKSASTSEAAQVPFD
mmetsp:Transcript_9391/g.21725  ORF Transcript_9391/g.21725 Transcript_9391/m.21725 type:complete len:241 (+) Transcript_9391:1108-1830(+)